MKIGNGGMPCFDIPKYEGDAVKDKPCGQGKEADFGQQFLQEDNEEKVLKGPQEIEGDGNFEKPDVHQIDPLRNETGFNNIMFLSEFRMGVNECEVDVSRALS